MLLLASAFSQSLHVYDHGALSAITEHVDRACYQDVSVILLQVVGRALCRQRDNGSWEDSVDRTSFEVVLISHAL